MMSSAEALQNRAAMRWSLAIGFVMLLGKSVAYWLTGSTAILSDAVESVIHIAAVGFAAYSLELSHAPAGERSPYGYGRIAFLSAGFEGGMISIAALGIIGLAAQKLIAGNRVEQLGAGTLLTLAASLINLALGLYLVRTGKRNRNIILEANGHHVLTDSWTSFGVVAGLAAVLVTGWAVLDPLVAIAVALNILWTAYSLLRRSVQGLLDIADPKVTHDLKQAAEQVARELGIEQHELRSRNAGQRILADIHLLFPNQMPIESAHELATEFEKRLARAVPFEVELVTHLEPLEEDAALNRTKHPGGEPTQ